MCFNYDLFLNLEGNPPVNHLRCEKLTFNNPTKEFRRKLIKAGGVRSRDTAAVWALPDRFHETSPELRCSASVWTHVHSVTPGFSLDPAKRIKGGFFVLKILMTSFQILVVPEGAEAMSRPSPDYPMLPTIPLSAFSDPKKTKTSHVSKVRQSFTAVGSLVHAKCLTSVNVTTSPLLFVWRKKKGTRAVLGPGWYRLDR